MLISLRKHFKKAQSTVEYGILIAVVVGAAVAMQVFVKRALQARQKDAADMATSVGGNFELVENSGMTATLNTTSQYEPYYLSRHEETITLQDELSKNIESGGAATITKNQQQRTGSAVIYRYSENQ